MRVYSKLAINKDQKTLKKSLPFDFIYIRKYSIKTKILNKFYNQFILLSIIKMETKKLEMISLKEWKKDMKQKTLETKSLLMDCLKSLKKKGEHLIDALGNAYINHCLRKLWISMAELEKMEEKELEDVACKMNILLLEEEWMPHVFSPYY